MSGDSIDRASLAARAVSLLDQAIAEIEHLRGTDHGLAYIGRRDNPALYFKDLPRPAKAENFSSTLGALSVELAGLVGRLGYRYPPFRFSRRAPRDSISSYEQVEWTDPRGAAINSVDYFKVTRINGAAAVGQVVVEHCSYLPPRPAFWDELLGALRVWRIEIGHELVRESQAAALTVSPPIKGWLAKRKRAALAWLGEAILTVRDHPEWPDSRIAQQIGVNPGTLSRSKPYRDAAEAVRRHARNAHAPPRGFRTRDPDSGEQDIEAYK